MVKCICGREYSDLVEWYEHIQKEHPELIEFLEGIYNLSFETIIRRAKLMKVLNPSLYRRIQESVEEIYQSLV